MAKVLITEDEQGLSELVHALLTDAGFTVSVLHEVSSDAIRVAVGQLEPDCVLLDGQRPGDYGESWLEAAWLHTRARSVPVIMFTATSPDLEEAAEHQSARSQAAHFAAILPKPFDLDQLVDAVRQAVGEAVPFDASPQAEATRTAALVARLQAAGAQEIHASTRRGWANFRTPRGSFIQLYWWQRDGVYYVMRHDERGGTIRRVGCFYDLEAAIAVAMTVEPSGD